MKKIEFGYETSNHPTGGWEGIGISPKEPITQAELIDIVFLEGENYLISRITNAFDKAQIGNVDVRRVIADLYHDGSGNLFADFEKDYNCHALEKIMTKENVKEQVEKGVSLTELYEGAYKPSGNFRILTEPSSITVNGIKTEVFEQKRQALANCHQTFSDMQQELEELKAKLQEYQTNLNQGGFKH